MSAGADADYNNASWLNPNLPRLYDWYDEYTDDLEAWRTLCAQSYQPVLDVACGTARVGLALARDGIKVYGIDISPAMIERAKEKANAERPPVRRMLSFAVGDMTDFRLVGRRFRTVIMPCFSFNELTTPEAQELCLDSVSRHMVMRAPLITALAPWREPERTDEPEEPSEWGDPLQEGINPHTGRLTRMWCISWGDPARQLKLHRFYFEESDEDGGSPRRFAIPEAPDWHTRRFLTPQEAEQMLTRRGFDIDELYGGWNFEPFTPESNVMLVVARKVERTPWGKRRGLRR